MFLVTMPLGYYISYRDTPIISDHAHDPELDDKETYSTLIRTGNSFKYLGDAVYEVRLLRVIMHFYSDNIMLFPFVYIQYKFRDSYDKTF